GDRRTGPLAVARKGTTDPGELPPVDQIVISPGYLATLKIGLLRGRDFSDADYAAKAPVAIIDQTAARQWFATVDPIGQRLTNGKTEFEIIGVAKVGLQRAPGTAAQPFVYLHYAPSGGYDRGPRMILHIRAQTAAQELYAAIRRETAQLDRRVGGAFPIVMAGIKSFARFPPP